MITQALRNLRPNSGWSLDGDAIRWNHAGEGTNFIWYGPGEMPSREELEAEVARLEQEWLDTQYQRDRINKYPPLSQLADALYWQAQGNTEPMTTYLAACAAVKQQFPKP